LGCHSRQPSDLFDPGTVQVDPSWRFGHSDPNRNSYVRTALTSRAVTNRIQNQHYADSKNDRNASHW